MERRGSAGATARPQRTRPYFRPELAGSAAMPGVDPTLLLSHVHRCGRCERPDQEFRLVTTRLVRTLVVLPLVCSFGFSQSTLTAQDAPGHVQVLPVNIHVDANLMPLVSMLLRKSATFRRQCMRIARAHHATVTVLAVPPLRETSTTRARATVRRFAYGAMRIVIEIPVAADYVELLPHELEHVIEQLEGVDLGALARAGGAGVIESDPGIFETARARAAGRAVVDEVYGAANPVISGASRQVARALRAIRERACGSTRAALPGR
jgi:hypothetical protein